MRICQYFRRPVKAAGMRSGKFSLFSLAPPRLSVCQFTPHAKRFRKVGDNMCIGELVCIQTNSSLHHELITYLYCRCSLHNKSTLMPSSTVFRAATSAYFRRATPTETHVTVAPSIGEPSQHTAKTLGYPSNHILIHAQLFHDWGKSLGLFRSRMLQ